MPNNPGGFRQTEKSIPREFIEKSPNGDQYILKKSMYKSLIGGEHKYYGSLPYFNREENAYKGKTFTEEEIMNVYTHCCKSFFWFGYPMTKSFVNY